jgi:hypothetical protein
MVQLDKTAIQNYLETRLGRSVRVVGLSLLGQDGGADVKGYGYGRPIKIDYELAGEPRSAVLETVTPGPFGHEHMADRAQILLWSHDAYNRLPQHVRSLDVGGFQKNGSLLSVGCVDEFFIVNEFVAGSGYNHDLERLRDGAPLDDRDLARADALCDYLVAIHRRRGPDPSLYQRRIRELVGNHECIMGILDAYPDGHECITADALRRIEHACIDWRWRLRGRGDRLCQVHGDFHPWNILFQDRASFVVLDRSRGEWGDAADDVAALTINYLFFALQARDRVDGALGQLFARFWERYLDATQDHELMAVIGPFFAFRGLVVANPVWYPNLKVSVRMKLLNFVNAMLDETVFDPARVAEYCERPRQ